MARAPKPKPLTQFQVKRAATVAALTAAGARFTVLRPRLTAGSCEIDVELAPANLALVERAMVPLDDRWTGLAARLAARPGTGVSIGSIETFKAVAMEPTAAPTGDAKELLAAVLANPDDDAPRLVLADWLIERGDKRGELIAMQCEYARTGDRHLASQIDLLLLSHRKAFAGSAAGFVEDRDFVRGFIDRLVMTMADAARKAPAIVAREPVRELALDDSAWTTDQLIEFADQPVLAAFRALQLAPVPVQVIGPLARSPHLGRLEHLRIANCGIGEADLEQLGSLTAPALERLELLAIRTSPGLHAALAANPSLRSLRSYRETLSTLEPCVSLGALAALPIEALELRETYTDQALAPFFDPATPATLRELIVVDAPITDDLTATIARSPKAQLLRVLRLHNTQLSLTAIRALLHALPQLEVAGFSGRANRTDSVHAELTRIFLDLPRTHALHTVDSWVVGPKPELRERYRVTQA